MTLMSTIQTQVQYELGLESVTTPASSRFIQWANEAIELWAKYHPDYYKNDIAYSTATISAYSTYTITVDGTDPYKLTVSAPPADTVLDGAVIYLNSVYGVARSVSSGVLRTQAPTRGMATGTGTIKQRSVIHDSTRVTIRRPRKTGGRWVQGNNTCGEMLYIQPEHFFALPDIANPTDVYPSYYTWNGSRFMINTVWPITNTFDVSIPIYGWPTAITTTSSTLYCPVNLEGLVQQYIVAKYRRATPGYKTDNLDMVMGQILRHNEY